MNFLVLHGAIGGSDTNWFPWLSNRLRACGHHVKVPQFPTPEGQTLDNWLQVVKKEVYWPASTTILIGHSLGVAFALHLAARSTDPFAAAFLVSGFFGKLGLPDYDQINESFFNTGIDWLIVKNNIGHIHCFASDNDPYVPLTRSREISNKLCCELTVIPNAGHINTHSGYLKFDKLADYLDVFLENRI